METLDQLIDRRTPLDATASCAEALERFIREPDALAIAVVDGAEPVGLLSREAFLARMEQPQTASLSVRHVLEPDPLIAEASESAQAFLDKAMAERPGALLSGFIAVEGGRYVGVGTAVTLLSLRNQRQRGKVEEANFLERIANEVKAPARASREAAERLKKLRLSEDAEAQVAIVADAATQIVGLLDTCAQLQRTVLGQARHEATPSRVQELMDEVEARWRARCSAADVTLLCAYDGDPDCSANLDPAWFHQAFDALIGHALAHVRSGVIEASLKTRRTDGEVFVEGSVRDNASSHTAAYLGGLFDTAGPVPEDGLGVHLGLLLAGIQIQTLGGSISAEANVGAGATITFSYVAREAAEAQAPEEAQESGRSAHILVVDDNATNRMVVEALCEMFDCSTESVADGLEAVDAARDGRFDVILMDIKMPRMDGVSATREIRRMEGPAGAVPIIALTANADPDEVREYISAGMRAVVEKPIKPEKLLEALEAALANHPSADLGVAAA
jgi:CheY-like chemotaxis protein